MIPEARDAAGHNYEVMRQKGFAKLMIEEGGKPKVVDNPKVYQKLNTPST